MLAPQIIWLPLTSFFPCRKASLHPYRKCLRSTVVIISFGCGGFLRPTYKLSFTRSILSYSMPLNCGGLCGCHLSYFPLVACVQLPFTQRGVSVSFWQRAVANFHSHIIPKRLLPGKSLKMCFLSLYFASNRFFVFYLQPSLLSRAKCSANLFKLIYFTIFVYFSPSEINLASGLLRKLLSGCSDNGLGGILEKLVNIPPKMLWIQTTAVVWRLYKLLKVGAW